MRGGGEDAVEQARPVGDRGGAEAAQQFVVRVGGRRDNGGAEVDGELDGDPVDDDLVTDPGLGDISADRRDDTRNAPL